jgi:F-type H+-transporting ATPase subunit b
MISYRRLCGLFILLGTLAFVVAPARAADESAKQADAKGSAEAKAAAEANGKEGKKAEDAEHLVEPDKVKSIVEVNPDLAVYSALVFLVLLAILGKFAWGPIIAGLQKREQGIADNIAAAQRTHDDAKLLLTDYERKLAGAADQVRVMLEEARREAEQTKVEIVAEAKEAARLEMERGKREVQLARDQALKELAERSTDMAVELAGKIIRAQLTQTDHARLVKEAMAEFAKN